jgi:hypothetical protein
LEDFEPDGPLLYAALVILQVGFDYILEQGLAAFACAEMRTAQKTVKLLANGVVVQDLLGRKTPLSVRILSQHRRIERRFGRASARFNNLFRNIRLGDVLYVAYTAPS